MATTTGALDGYANDCSTQVGGVPIGAFTQPKPASGVGLGNPQITAVYWPGGAQRALVHAIAWAPQWSET